MPMKFKVGQVVRFCGDDGHDGDIASFPDEGAIGVVTRVSYGASAYPYSVRWFLSKPETTEHYAKIELRAVEEIEHVDEI